MVLDPVGHTVLLQTPGMKLDVGGIAKGYAAQAALEVLKGTRRQVLAGRRRGRYRGGRGTSG